MKRFREDMRPLFVPSEWCGPLKNPCKGWMSERPNGDGHLPGDMFAGYDPAFQDFFSTAYARFNWKDLNPAKEVYDFSRIDRFLEHAAARGWTVGIGFLTPAASTSKQLSLAPDYLYAEGMAFVESTVENNHTFEQWPQRTPVWDDPVYLKYCDIVVAELARRYDGDPRIFFVNPLTYGNWGEWHTQFLGDSVPLSFEAAKLHVEIWQRHWHKSILQIPINHHMPELVAQWACDTYGWGMTRWGLVYQPEDHCAASYCLNTAPALGEFYTSYERTKTWGSWSDERMTDVIEGGHLTNMRVYADDVNLIWRENKKLVENLHNRMGYHIVVRSAAEYFENNEPDECEFGLIVENKGVTPMYFPCILMVALLDYSGKVLERYATPVNPRRWWGNSFSAFRFRAPIADKEGRVAVGLFKDPTQEHPDVRWANQQLEHGWLILR